jgi:lysine-N-methylase
MKSTACKAGAAKNCIKLYAPRYYRAFSCIADRCRHSCCIGWEIDVDEQMLELYRSLSVGYGKTVAESIDEEDVPHFRLVAGDRCPHLDEQGLCRIIKSMGKGYLCEICREHPRFYHDTPRGKEVGVGMACEEAARLILQSEDFDSFVEIGAVEGRALRGRRRRRS